MQNLSGKARSEAVQDMFQDIAPHYDLMNRLMTGGQDRAWRRFVVEQIALPRGGSALDLATGTGDIAFEIARHDSTARTIAADFAPAMMIVGQRRSMGSRVRWVMSDALHLPFGSGAFDAVTHGFLLRNVIDIPGALKPGGRVVSLDTSPPPPSLLTPAIRLHLDVVIPTLGVLLAGNKGAYTYLPTTTVGFKTPEQLTALFRDAGFVDIGYKRFMFGSIAVVWATKPRR
jgi:demethylmenaquinone methyltransferase / 2-methoxy-6-polyprenyl-1,4-benzoquinol methylase